MKREAILDSVYKAVDTLNAQLEPGLRLEKNESTVLYGVDGRLDSLGLVTLIVHTEQQLAEDLGIYLTLADEKALSQKRSPFRTIGALAEYVGSLMEGGGDAPSS